MQFLLRFAFQVWAWEPAFLHSCRAISFVLRVFFGKPGRVKTFGKIIQALEHTIILKSMTWPFEFVMGLALQTLCMQGPKICGVACISASTHKQCSCFFDEFWEYFGSISPPLGATLRVVGVTLLRH